MRNNIEMQFFPGFEEQDAALNNLQEREQGLLLNIATITASDSRYQQ